MKDYKNYCYRIWTLSYCIILYACT